MFLDAVHELPPDLQRALHATLERDREPPSPRRIEQCRRAADRLDDARYASAAAGRFPAALSIARGEPRQRASAHRSAEDIPALVDHFVRRHARRLGKVIDGVSPDSMRRLEAYAWPGNIRELRTVLERAVLVCKSTVLEVDEEQLNEALAVGSYRLVSPLGSGGMGEVWLARHRLPRPSCGGQAHSPRRRAGRGARAARATVRARSAGDRRAAVAAHRAAVRLRRE